MQVFELKGEERKELGKKSSKEARLNGMVPCVIYGGGSNTNFTVSEKDLKNLLYTPKVYVVKLMLGKKVHNCVMREIQFHPTSDRPLHIDFYEISDDKEVAIEVPIKLNGFAAGVQAGGKLSQIVRKLKVKAIPANLPDIINIDVTNLGLGKTIKVKELHFDGFEIVNAKEVVVAQVKATRASKGDDAAAPAAAAAAPAAAAPAAPAADKK